MPPHQPLYTTCFFRCSSSCCCGSNSTAVFPAALSSMTWIWYSSTWCIHHCRQYYLVYLTRMSQQQHWWGNHTFIGRDQTVRYGFATPWKFWLFPFFLFANGSISCSLLASKFSPSLCKAPVMLKKTILPIGCCLCFQVYRKHSYFICILDAIWQSLVEFFIPYFVSISFLWIKHRDSVPPL